MQWETKKVLVTVKAYPERSTKHGEVVCLSGITEDSKFIRLYPVPFEYFRGKNKIPKYSWIEVQCKKAEGEILGRKESHRIRDGTGIRVIDSSLVGNGKTPWDKRKKVVLPLISRSIEELEDRFKNDRTSLGLVKVHELIDFFSKTPLNEVDRERQDMLQATLFKEQRSILERIPHIFYYRFKCCEGCKTHEMSIEDWEVFESFRKWSDLYPNEEVLWQKLRQRYYEDFSKKDLHFYLGMHSRWPTWMIIGAFYPPR